MFSAQDTPSPWSPVEPLRPGQTVLLEASAGTGKTWQLASLVLRLIAEYRVPLPRILAISFTRAATAELKARIRRRLEEGREVLRGAAPPHDEVVRHLVAADESERAARRLAIDEALANFDEAPVWTIHAFAQRMLSQFAFESGQEAGLKPVEDPDALLAERVDDALAGSFARLDGPSVEVLQALGWRRDNLLAIARRMASAVAPALRPIPSGSIAPVDEPLTPATRARLAALLADTEALREAWSPSGAAVAALNGAVATKALHDWHGNRLGARLRELRQLLDAPANLASASTTTAEKVLPWQHLLPDRLQAKWRGPAGSLEAQPFWELSRALEILIHNAREALAEVRPVLAFAHGVRAALRAELARRRALTHDTMLSLLAERIAETGPDGPLAQAIRGRFDVALVDEFQDTDGAQWSIIASVFGNRVPGEGATGGPAEMAGDSPSGGWHGDGFHALERTSQSATSLGDGRLTGRTDARRALFLIGDPKQAIYAFRGGDVHIYLRAARTVDARRTMTTNFRSEPGLVKALNTLWGTAPTAFGNPEVAYVEVSARGADDDAEGRGGDAPLDLRWFDQETVARQLAAQLGDSLPPDPREAPGATGKGHPNVADATACVARLAAREALRLATEGGVDPGDMAVLVKGHREAWLMKRELERLGLPAVRSASGNVYASEPARWLVAWLRALAGGRGDRWMRVVATTPLFGWTVQRLAEADAADASDAAPTTLAGLKWNDLCANLSAWGEGFIREGFIRTFDATCAAAGVMARVLGGLDGERHATDLRHLVELVHLRSLACSSPGPLELADWLADQLPTEGGDATRAEAEESRAQRLETDARAVAIMTMHASKGLEFPVVLVPFGWHGDPHQVRGQSFLWHDEAGDAVLDLRPADDPERSDAVERHLAEAAEESMRLLYVALTRAGRRTVAWMTVAGEAAAFDRSPLGRLLLGGAPADHGKGEHRALFLARLSALEAASGGRITGRVEEVDSAAPKRWRPAEAASTARAEARPWLGRLAFPNPRERVSFTSLTSRTPEAAADEPTPPEPVILGPMGESGDVVVVAEPAPATAPSQAEGPLDGLRGGKDIGVWLHGVFEAIDFATLTGPLGEPLDAVLAQAAIRAGVAPTSDELARLREALPRMLGTPLDGPAPASGEALPAGFRLADLPRRDRLDELAFDLRMSGEAVSAALPGALALRTDERWDGAAWLAQALHEQTFRLPPAGGALNGAIDLVFRVDGRYWIVDYKTNQSPPAAQGHAYGRDGLARLMGEAHYHLQALLYTLALHRLLRQRLGRRYDYDRHLGGHLYLFLRGLAGPESPRQADGGRLGVFQDRWPRAVVEALDAALGGPNPEMPHV